VKPLLIFDFFAGTGSSTIAFKDAGHTVITFELDPSFDATETVDIMSLSAKDLLERYGMPDFIWASPPCTAFSVASIGHHWSLTNGEYIPKTDAARYNQKIVEHTRKLINDLQPKYGFLMENPRGMLRKLPAVEGLQRQTISYCSYGDSRMKPTDLWGAVDGWEPRPMCKYGDPCHEAAPRGSRTGTQGMKHAKYRSMIPRQLSEDVLRAISAKIKEQK